MMWQLGIVSILFCCLKHYYLLYSLRFFNHLIEPLIDIFVDSCTVVRNNTERSHVSFTHFPARVTSCRTIVRYYKQGIDIFVTTRTCHGALLYPHPLPFVPSLTPGNHYFFFSIAIILSFEIILYKWDHTVHNLLTLAFFH